jgi:hypothetical protein
MKSTTTKESTVMFSYVRISHPMEKICNFRLPLSSKEPFVSTSNSLLIDLTSSYRAVLSKSLVISVFLNISTSYKDCSSAITLRSKSSSKRTFFASQHYQILPHSIFSNQFSTLTIYTPK